MDKEKVNTVYKEIEKILFNLNFDEQLEVLRLVDDLRKRDHLIAE